MRWMGYSMVFLAALFGGFYASMLLEKRKNQLLGLKRAVTFLGREIDCRLSSLEEAFLHTADRVEEPWKGFFAKAGESMGNLGEGEESFEAMWLGLVKRAVQFHPWKGDLDILRALGQGLGQLDKKMQLEGLSLAAEEICQAEAEAGEEYKRKGHLYRMLGACLGLLAVILLI